MSRFSETSNPAFTSDNLDRLIYENRVNTDSPAGLMTIGGVVNKTAIYLGIITAVAILNFYLAMNGSPYALPLTVGGMFVAFGLAFFVMSKPSRASTWGLLYAVCEGLFLGGVSAKYYSYTGGDPIIIQAVGLTLATLFTMLAVYRFRIIRVTEKFKSVMIVAGVAVTLYYVVNYVIATFFGIYFMDPLASGAWYGPIICGVILIFAAFMLLLDFDFIENSIREGAPKQIEWYSALGLTMTLVLLYFEFLRLTALLSGD